MVSTLTDMHGEVQNARRVRELINRAVASGDLLGAAVQWTAGGAAGGIAVGGSRRLHDPAAAVSVDTIFLVASVTKPIVAIGVMQLVESGEVLLSDPVARYIPEFAQNGKHDVTVRHLLTHTSGLPDQIPENVAYRRAKRPLADFIERICELPIRFEPGTRISYQSTGIAVAGEICAIVSGLDLPTYLAQTVFDPLAMRDTALGVSRRSDREAEIRIPAAVARRYGDGVDWNSDYWRGFGAPWGGLLTTIGDLTRLLLAMRNGGGLDGRRILCRASVSTMTPDQTSALPRIYREDAREQEWGLGWRLNRTGAGIFGDLPSRSTYGHQGDSGTLVWVDPENDVTGVVLTNDPATAVRMRGQVANAVTASVTHEKC